MAVPQPTTTPLEQRLLDQLVALLAPIADAAGDAALVRELVTSVGWNADVLAGGPLDALLAAAASVGGALDAVAALGGGPLDLDEVAAALAKIGEATRALTPPADAWTALPVGAAETFFGDLLSALLQATLEDRLPVVDALLSLVGVTSRAAGQPLTTGSGTALRDARQRFSVDPGTVGRLLTDPVGLLHDRFAVDGTTARLPQQIADDAGPAVAQLLRAVGLHAWYGNPDPTGGPPLTPDEAAVAAHLLHVAFVYRIDPTAPDFAALTVALALDRVSGEVAVIVAPAGTLELDRAYGSVKATAQLEADAPHVVIRRSGVAFAPGATPHATLTVTLDRPPAPEPLLRLGAPTGTRAELGGFTLAATLDASPAGPQLQVALELAAARVAVGAPSGDGFLSSFLPADPVVADLPLALDWSPSTGLRVRGGSGLRTTLAAHVALGPLTLSAVTLALDAGADGVQLELSSALALALGPFTAAVDRLGIEAQIRSAAAGGSLGPLDVHLAPKPPSGIGLSIDAAGCSGSGYLFGDPAQHQYAGALHLEFEGIALNAVGLLTTQLPDGSPGFSLLIVISASGFTPLQLGFGFELTGVGGIAGVQRTVAIDVLRAKLTSGELDPVLFLDGDPVPRAPEIVRALQTVFPPAAGRYAFGPTAKLAWGTPTIFTLDLALVLELPAPVRLALLGRLRSVLPTEDEKLVELHMNVLGVVDFGRREAAVDARLHDSHLVGFTLTGAMALRASWGDQPNLLLSIGGFNPRFTPPPAFPQLERVAIALASGDNPRLRLEAYLAVTSNTLQLGARLDFYVGVAGFSLSGVFAFDGLVQFSPFSFVVDVCASLALKAGDTTLMAISVQMTLSGPAPWHVKGNASFSILFFSITISFDATFGPAAPAPQLPAVDVWAVLHDELAKTANWNAPLPDGRQIFRLRGGSNGQGVLAHPLGTLGVTQRLVPLERTIEVYGNAPVQQTRAFHVAQVSVAGVSQPFTPTYAEFAPAQFRRLGDDEKLAAPSFDRMPAGVALSAPGPGYGHGLDAVVAYDTTVVARDGTSTELPQPTPLPAPVAVATAPTGAAGLSTARGRLRYRGDGPPLVGVGPRRFAVADRDTLTAVPGATGVDDSWSATADAVDRVAQPMRPSAQIVGREEVLA